jgi:hypothetical protein
MHRPQRFCQDLQVVTAQSTHLFPIDAGVVATCAGEGIKDSAATRVWPKLAGKTGHPNRQITRITADPRTRL